MYIFIYIYIWYLHIYYLYNLYIYIHITCTPLTQTAPLDHLRFWCTVRWIYPSWWVNWWWHVGCPEIQGVQGVQVWKAADVVVWLLDIACSRWLLLVLHPGTIWDHLRYRPGHPERSTQQSRDFRAHGEQQDIPGPPMWQTPKNHWVRCRLPNQRLILLFWFGMCSLLFSNDN